MSNQQTFLEALKDRGVSRRAFLKFAAVTASSLALSGKQARLFTEALAAAPKPTVVWLSFQQCTGCSESILRSFNPSIENLILNTISLDYHETLQVAAGYQAEKALADAMQSAYGNYVLILDGAIPSGQTEFWSCTAGNSSLAALNEAVGGAALVLALGTCATFGGIPAAYPNPTNASGYGDLVSKGLVKAAAGKKLPPYVNVAGCPPLAEVITGSIAAYLAGGLAGVPLDALNRPSAFYGTDRTAQTVHDTCPRHAHWEANEFANSHGDAGAQQGYCLLRLGCRGPQTHNACTRLGWNTDPKDNGRFKNSPTHTGHGCLGCSEPQFWDKGAGGTVFSGSFYTLKQ